MEYNDLPKISIITPNYNGGGYLEETILSVLSQKYENLEYIIIDGGSTDNSLEIIKKYESKLTYWVSEPDKGLYDAVQKGFDKSTGEIMAWINSDDLYHPKSFSVVSEIFSKFNRVKWLQGCPTSFDENGRIISTGPFKRWSKLDYYLGDFKWIQQESAFWHRSLWNKSGGTIDTKLKYAGDLDLWLRFFRYEQLFVTTAILAGFRLRASNQLSLDHLDEYVLEAEKVISNELENNLTEKEKTVLDKIKRLSKSVNTNRNRLVNLINRQLFGTKLNEIKQQEYPLPNVISFDRITQEFKC